MKKIVKMVATKLAQSGKALRNAPAGSSPDQYMKSGGKMEKDNTKKKAPRPAIPSRKKPNFMKESDSKDNRTSPMLPMKQKRLSK